MIMCCAAQRRVCSSSGVLSPRARKSRRSSVAVGGECIGRAAALDVRRGCAPVALSRKLYPEKKETDYDACWNITIINFRKERVELWSCGGRVQPKVRDAGRDYLSPTEL